MAPKYKSTASSGAQLKKKMIHSRAGRTHQLCWKLWDLIQYIQNKSKYQGYFWLCYFCLIPDFEINLQVRWKFTLLKFLFPSKKTEGKLCINRFSLLFKQQLFHIFQIFVPRNAFFFFVGNLVQQYLYIFLMYILKYI